MAGPIPSLLSLLKGPAVASFDDRDIPGVTRCEPSEREIGSSSETASGRMRFDTVASKRTWRVEATGIPLATLDSLYQYLKYEKMWGWGDWWCWRMGEREAVTVRARITEWHERPVGRLSSLWTVSFTVIEQ